MIYVKKAYCLPRYYKFGQSHLKRQSGYQVSFKSIGFQYAQNCLLNFKEIKRNVKKQSNSIFMI